MFKKKENDNHKCYDKERARMHKQKVTLKEKKI